MHRSKHALKFRAMNFRPAAPERQPKSGRGEIRAMPGRCRDKSVHRSKHAMKFRATCLRRAAPERQPKSSRGENPGNTRAGAARNSCTEARPRRSFGQRVYAEPRRSDNRNQAAAKTRVTPGQVPREIHAPKQGRDDVSGNVFKSGRAGATTEIKPR